MLTKIVARLKDPITYVIAAVAIVVALAVPAIAKVFSPVAKIIPGSKA